MGLVSWPGAAEHSIQSGSVSDYVSEGDKTRCAFVVIYEDRPM